MNSRLLFRKTMNPFAVVCPRCQKFATIPFLYSGHNRWSKIKHDKAKEDKSKSRQRQLLTKEITQASMAGGDDPRFNSHLAQAISNAKKAGFPKSSIEMAVARGQGKSISGAPLEMLTIEAVLPSAVAAVIECQTEAKARTLQEIRHVIRSSGGTITPTMYLFQKKGKIVFEKHDSVGVDETFDKAIEAGATDVDEEEQQLVIFTEPSRLKEAEDALTSSLGLKIASSDIIWAPNKETLVQLDSEEAESSLEKCLDAIEQNPSVQGIYLNVS